MLVTRNYKNWSVIFRFKKHYKLTKFLGYSDNLLLTNKGFLKSPHVLFSNNMCLFFNIAHHTTHEFNMISYKGYIITNYKIIKSMSKKKNYLSLKNNFLRIYLLFHLYNIFVKIINILLNLVMVVNKYKI
jgi:hypothetical protein